MLNSANPVPDSKHCISTTECDSGMCIPFKMTLHSALEVMTSGVAGGRAEFPI